MRKHRLVLSLFAVVASAGAAFAQTNSSTNAGNIVVAAPRFWESKEFWTTALILVFGLIIVGVEYLLLRNRQHDKVEEFSKFFVITVIIIGTLVLIGSGLDNNQIAPAVGLFGTIAGYLLGRTDRAADNRGAPDRDTKPN
jgi:hypothetical protein